MRRSHAGGYALRRNCAKGPKRGGATRRSCAGGICRAESLLETCVELSRAWGLQSSCRTREKTSRLLTRVRAVRATQPPETRKNPFQHPLRLLPPNIARVRVCPCERFRKRCIFSNERNFIKKTSEGVTRETLSDGNPATSPHALARFWRQWPCTLRNRAGTGSETAGKAAGCTSDPGKHVSGCARDAKRRCAGAGRAYESGDTICMRSRLSRRRLGMPAKEMH